MEKHHRRLKEQMVLAMELPQDLAFHEPVLTVTGDTALCIENYKSLLEYTGEQIIVSTQKGRLLVRGRNLEICFYTGDEMQISGQFQEICFFSGA